MAAAGLLAFRNPRLAMAQEANCSLSTRSSRLNSWSKSNVIAMCAVLVDFDGDDVAHLGEVGDGADRPLVGFERLDPDPRRSDGNNAPRQRRGRKALIGVSARMPAPSGMIGPCAERL